MTCIYLDHNATTPVDPVVLVAMVPYFSADFANASSIHTPGQRARAAVETAREQVAALIGAKPQEIVFTSGGTESDNHAIFGSVAQALLPVPFGPSKQSPTAQSLSAVRHESPVDTPQTRSATSAAPPPSPSFTSSASSTSGSASPHVITSTIEHEAVLNSCQALEQQGVAVTYLPVNRDGLVDPASIRAAIRPETALITLMHANNELGTVQPLDEIGRIAQEYKIPFHTDAVQSAGKVPIDVNALHVDLLSLSAHKLYGPKGIGALYVRTGTKLQQLLYGGHHQRGFRPGTENVAAIVGFGKAAELAAQALVSDAARISVLRDQLERGLLERIPHTRVNGAVAPRTPNTTDILFEGIEGEALVIALDLKGVACSVGAACSSGAVEPSHVLTAIGLSHDEAKSSLRFSLGRHTTAAEIAFALDIIPAAVSQLRALSPTYQKASARP
jgi:cysteine desulfurase